MGLRKTGRAKLDPLWLGVTDANDTRLDQGKNHSKAMSLFLHIVASLVILFPLYLIYRPPYLLICYFQRQWPDVLWHVPLPPTRKLMALTIDDSPSEYTDKIQEIMKSNGATATFFIIGDQIVSQEREETLQDLVRNGNELANHALHDEPSRSLSDDELAAQIKIVNARIQEIYSSAQGKSRGIIPRRPPNYFRPGSGFFSSNMRRVVADLDHRLVLGNVYPHDPVVPFWWVNARHILSMLRPGGIIVCHDRRKWTVPMLRYLLPEMARRGYRVVTVTELLKEA